MSTKLLLEYADISILVATIAILTLMWRKQLFATFRALALFLSTVLVLEAVQIPILFFRRYTGLDKTHAYNVLFYSTEVLSCIQCALVMAVIYSIFQIAMRPLPGLRHMGNLIFKWVAGVSLLLGVAIAFGPHVFASGFESTVAVTTVIERAQEGISVLTLCLLLFVCISAKPLGLTFRSHIFGVSLGMGLISTVDLVQSAWFWTTQAHNLYSPIYLISAVGYIVAMTTWSVYFAAPEPARKLILLPTTSPFFHWNRIAEALGDAPGNVAIGFNASMISPIETKMMTAMSRSSREREAAEARAEESEKADSFVAS